MLGRCAELGSLIQIDGLLCVCGAWRGAMIIWSGWRKKDDVSIKWFMARKLMAVDLVDRIRGRLKSSLPAAVPLTSHSSTTINHAPVNTASAIQSAPSVASIFSPSLVHLYRQNRCPRIMHCSNVCAAHQLPDT